MAVSLPFDPDTKITIPCDPTWTCRPGYLMGFRVAAEETEMAARKKTAANVEPMVEDEQDEFYDIEARVWSALSADFCWLAAQVIEILDKAPRMFEGTAHQAVALGHYEATLVRETLDTIIKRAKKLE